MPRFAASGLEPGHTYLAGVFAYNPKGRSEPVVMQAATLRLPEKQLTEEKGIGKMIDIFMYGQFDVLHIIKIL